MLRRFAKILLLALTIALILTIAYTILFGGFAQSLTGEEHSIYYRKTIRYMNKTAYYIAIKKPALDVDPSDLLKIHEYYIREYNKLLNTRGVKYEELATLETYLNLSKTVNNLYNMSLDWPSIWVVLTKSTEALSEMDIDKALSLYKANEHRILALRESVNETLTILEHTKYVKYTPIEHQKVVNYTIDVLKKILDLLDEYIKLMELLKYYHSSLSNAIQTRNSTEIKNIGETIAEQIDLEKLDGLTGNVSDFLSQLLSGLPERSSSQSTQPYAGEGGGYTGGPAND